MHRLKLAEVLVDLRNRARPRDLLGRVQLLLLGFGLANLVGAEFMAAASGAAPLYLYLAGMAAPPTLAVCWLIAYHRREFDLAGDAVVIGAICVFTMAIDPLWNDYGAAL